ncbi:hypothetical protein LEP1GSC203_1216 [Leptospira terpstrae serovar Hualin str. LT 11-33 = ATCC 700639]|uniref:Uncharacterized protein n=1 Tax=Leptospira terpstrae serovar Hualin str. LT 11-33 = ATCC 700639 TaxID=1257025 RepID=N1W1K3_9LEPT|nr:hypothetical protein LEP1GSC203_1216 [Leptospira terpstrae serovar Hualin str. LT 11-33 = ATCC 700639]
MFGSIEKIESDSESKYNLNTVQTNGSIGISLNKQRLSKDFFAA